MNLYLPISSKNFSLIFETESVSPKSFYDKRTYGTTRFRPCSLDIDDNYLCLFSIPPSFSFGERDTYPMWLEFERENLASGLTDICEYYSEIGSGKVYLYPQTIYFDSLSFRCIFQEKQHLINSKIDSESYRNVKATDKYRIEVESPDFFKKTPVIPVLNIPPNSILDVELDKDKKFNNVKGFIYGYTLGEVQESPEKDKLFKAIIEIQNSFTNAKARMLIDNSATEKYYANNQKKTSGKSKDSYSSKSSYIPPKYNPAESRGEILDLIDFVQNLFQALFPRTAKPQEDKVLAMAKQLLRELQAENADENLILDCSNFIESISIRNDSFQLLKKAVLDFFKSSVSKAYSAPEIAEMAERRFKTNLSLIQRTIENKFLHSDNEISNFDLTKFFYEIPGTIKIDSRKVKLSGSKEYLLFEIIVGSLIKYPRPAKQGEITREEKCEIIKRIATHPLFVNQLGNKTNRTDYYRDLLLLHNHYAKFEDFNFNLSKSDILKNFACFLTKIERFEDLLEFTISKKIDNRAFALGLWGAFNGFAALSGKDSKFIFSSPDLRLINSFDNWLNNILKLLEQETFEGGLDNKPTDIEESNSDDFASSNINESTASTPPSYSALSSSEQSQVNEPNQDSASETEKAKSLVRNFTLRALQTLSESKFNKEQKEDIQSALKQTQETVNKSLDDGAEVYLKMEFVFNLFRKHILDRNKKRKKKEFKIPENDLIIFLDPLKDGLNK
jgi:hypothetical protein